MSDAKPLTHTHSCMGDTFDHDCTCGLYWRIALQTEQTEHAAWRNRAVEAEAEVRRLGKLNIALSDALHFFGYFPGGDAK
jgi:hypothetical protein